MSPTGAAAVVVHPLWAATTPPARRKASTWRHRAGAGKPGGQTHKREKTGGETKTKREKSGDPLENGWFMIQPGK